MNHPAMNGGELAEEPCNERSGVSQRPPATAPRSLSWLPPAGVNPSSLFPFGAEEVAARAAVNDTWDDAALRASKRPPTMRPPSMRPRRWSRAPASALSTPPDPESSPVQVFSREQVLEGAALAPAPRRNPTLTTVKARRPSRVLSKTFIENRRKVARVYSVLAAAGLVLAVGLLAFAIRSGYGSLIFGSLGCLL